MTDMITAQGASCLHCSHGRVSSILWLSLVGRVDGLATFAFRAAETRRWGDSVHEAKFDMPAPAACATEEVDILGPVLDDRVEVIRSTCRTYLQLAVEEMARAPVGFGPFVGLRLRGIHDRLLRWVVRATQVAQ